MKVAILISLLSLPLISYTSLAVDCGHQDIKKCEFPNIETKTIQNDSRYQHFGMIAKGFDGRLSLVYRDGLNHLIGGKIYLSQSIDNGVSWIGTEQNLKRTEISTNSGVNIDYRDPNIGYTNDGTLIVNYVRQTHSIVNGKKAAVTTEWKYRFSIDNGENWSLESDFFDSSFTNGVALSNGLPYGRINAIPGTRNEVIATGYYSKDGKYYLGNWKGIVSTNGSASSIDWVELTPTAITEGSFYDYAEHSVLPLNQNVWVAVSRGPTSLTLFKTVDGGQNWFDIGEIRDISISTAFHTRVAPMLDIMYQDGQRRLVLLYTKRSSCSSGAPACSFVRFGSHVESFIDNSLTELNRIDWSEEVPISSFNKSLSGYQSGIFLDNDIEKYLHLEFHEKSHSEDQTFPEDSDIQTTLLDFKNLLLNQNFESYPSLNDSDNLLSGSYFHGLSSTLGTWDATDPQPLVSGWRLVLSGAKIEVKDGGQPGFGETLHLNVIRGDDYAGINKDFSTNKTELLGQLVHVSFYAKSDSTSENVELYYRIDDNNSGKNWFHKNVTISPDWKLEEECVRVPSNLSLENENSRLTIGYRNNSSVGLLIDNVIVRPAISKIGPGLSSPFSPSTSCKPVEN